MKCQMCGSHMTEITTSVPFKIGDQTIVVLRDLPVLQCDGCSEYLLDDLVMERVDSILDKVDQAAELEVIHYAA